MYIYIIYKNEAKATTQSTNSEDLRPHFVGKSFGDASVDGKYHRLKNNDCILLGGLEHQLYFPINIGNLIIPIDELIFFRGVAKTTNQ